MRERGSFGILPIIITVLALADGGLHLLLDFVLFRGNLFGPLGPPPGPTPGAAPGGAPAPPRPPVPLPLPLNQLFALNFIGYVVLVVAFWLAPRWLGKRRWLVDIVIIVYTLASILGWLELGGPNPMGLGYTAKALEVALIVALLAHIWSILRRPETDTRPMEVEAPPAD